MYRRLDMLHSQRTSTACRVSLYGTDTGMASGTGTADYHTAY